jgi:low temperature requirement protein LtrA
MHSTNACAHQLERYGFLNIIVLGETLLASMMANRSLTDATQQPLLLLQMPLLAIVLLFCLWWLYFSQEEQLQQHNLRMALTWGYGHLIIYAAGAAVGAGVAVNIDLLLGQAELNPATAIASVTLPVSLYLAGLWLVRDRFVFVGFGKYTLPLFALLIPLAGQLAGLTSAVLLLVLCVFIRSSKACCCAHDNINGDKAT